MLTIARQVFNLLPFSVKHSLRQKYHAYKKQRFQSELQALGIGQMEAVDNNHLLHALRGQALAQLPNGVPHFVSVGCAGTWYFNWIAQQCRPQHHTGIEFYMPRPADLPPGVTWIANTAGSMPELGDGVADILFSGQNIEHLWPQDILGFLQESHRVLKPDGMLVIDSPNRYITAKLQWSQPEHTVEFVAEEMVELLELAGFDVVKKRGLWLCEDPQSGGILPLELLSTEGPWPMTRRVHEAADCLRSSFVWWIEARKSTRAPQLERLKARIREIYDPAWAERLNRLKTLTGTEVQHGGATWFDSGGRGGYLLFGPYAPLAAGRYTVSFQLMFPDGAAPTSRPEVICDVAAGNVIVARREFKAHDNAGAPVEVAIEFSLEDTTFAVEFRVLANEGVRVLAKKAISLVSLSNS